MPDDRAVPPEASQPNSAPPPSTPPGSQSALRAANTRRLLDALHERGPLTQTALAHASGLSRASVSNLTKLLEDEGAVVISAANVSGKRAHLVSAAPTGEAALGIDIGRTHIRAVLVSRERAVLQEEHVPLDSGANPAAALTTATQLSRQLIARHTAGSGGTPDVLVGAGVGLPGPIDARTGNVAYGEILPQWVGVDVRGRLSEELGIPVFLDNDANMGALAEIQFGGHQQVTDMIYVKVASGIGAGLVIDGRVYHGGLGVTGELGHSPVTDAGPLCRCGNRGCLETYASVRIIRKQLSQHSDAPVTVDSLIERGLAGDVAVVRLVEDAGLALGRAIAALANTLSPHAIVFGGPLTPLKDTLLDPIRRAFTRHAIPLVSQNTELKLSALEEQSEALGAAIMVLNRMR